MSQADLEPEPGIGNGRVSASFIRVLIVDDARQFQEFLALFLLERPKFQVIATVSDGLEAVRSAHELQPDLILLDIGLPRLNGIEAARRIRELSPRSRILFVSQESSPDVVQEALRTGASGYVVKLDAGRELLAAVDSVLRGEQYIGNRFALHHFAEGKAAM